jgi:thiol-disulfide isomerase/thioredoxin
VTTVRELVGDGPAVVAFWASYCAPCKAEVPALNRAAERWGPRGVRVIGVSLEADVARVKEAAKAWDAHYDVYPLVEGQEKTTEALFPNGLPTSVFVRKGSTTVHEKRLDDADLDRLVPPLLDAAAR